MGFVTDQLYDTLLFLCADCWVRLRVHLLGLKFFALGTWQDYQSQMATMPSHSPNRQRDWSYLYMNLWVGHTLTDTTWPEPVPLILPSHSSLFPSLPKLLFPPHNLSPFSLQELPSWSTCTRRTHQLSEQDPTMCCWYYMEWGTLVKSFIVFFKWFLYKVHVLPGKTASSSARSQDKSKEIVPWTRKKECGPFK